MEGTKISCRRRQFLKNYLYIFPRDRRNHHRDTAPYFIYDPPYTYSISLILLSGPDFSRYGPSSPTNSLPFSKTNNSIMVLTANSFINNSYDLMTFTCQIKSANRIYKQALSHQVFGIPKSILYRIRVP